MLLSCRGIKKSYGEINVLNGVNLDISCSDRIGLVGRNGAGKTTLANILCGCLDCDEGSIITSRKRLKIGYLRQHEAQAELSLQVHNSEAEENGEFQRLASYLGLNRVQEWSEERLQNLSGGEKTKLALASILASQPDLIVLDEPTNHMDYLGVKQLVAELAAFKGAAIIISHDRYFLDRTVTQIVEIEKGIAKVYQGNYSAYRETKRQELESQWHAYQSQKKEQRKLEAAIARLKTWSEKAHRESRRKGEGIGGKEYFRKKAKKRDRAIKSQIKRLEKMRQAGAERPPEELQVNFNLMAASQKKGQRLLEAKEISKSYGENLLFTDSSFYVKWGEKVGILGANGCGKTTLLKLILGQESLDKGEIFLSQSARVAYVSQQLPLDEGENFKELIMKLPLEQQKQLIQMLIALGIGYDRLQLALGELSQGERRKIAMGLALKGEYDLLILDEPSNHLDLYSREALEESLLQFPGTVLVASHDQYLLQQVCDHLLVFTRQKIIRVEGKLADYLASENTNTGKVVADKGVSYEEKLLIETKISRVLSELSLYNPGDPNYAALDCEYQRLLKCRKELNNRS
ncbi:MAG: ABC-F family ATP-binding cassette domain-containing protein [Clostridia bacterium]|nr:ABC-F family ATP-binding cassette domain-containing protein [Clostridia bacterium]